MDTSSQQFIDYQHAIREHKTDLNNHLGADEDGVFVYFLAPLSNILRMRETGVILPRNRAANFHDLSDQTIQQNREKSVMVHRDDVTKQVLVHDCINMFLNPINNTFFAFRRNARIRENLHDPLSSVVGIIELDLVSILDIENILWCVSMGNLAGNGYEGNQYRGYPWPQILSLHYTKDPYDDFRASEFLVFSDQVDGIPFACVNRILALQQDLARIDHNDIHDFEISEVNHDQAVFVFNDELHNDRKFWKIEGEIVDLVSLLYQQDFTGLFSRALEAVCRTERQIDMSLRDSFLKKEFADDYIHGAVHVVRVMFWIHILAEIYSRTIHHLSEGTIKAMMYAGFLHDLCRTDNLEEEDHGKAAADKFKSMIRREIAYPDSDRCLLAISEHSKALDPLYGDIVWELVKDADALDRGRFGSPTSDKGCDQSKLRLKFIKKGSYLSDKISWAAYFLPRVTQYIRWTDHPCQDFVSTVQSSRRCVQAG